MSDVVSQKIIPLSEPQICGNEWKYIKECLDTGWVSSAGNYVNRFEETLAKYTGAKYAVAIMNGTAALHVSLIACGVEPNDEVIAPTLTFIAPANAVRYCSAYPVFMDCDSKTLCLDTAKVADFIKKECVLKNGFTYNKKTKRRVKAIIPVHVFGHPVDMENLVKVCKKNNIDVIEDATESLGSLYKGKKTGTLGTAGCFSFNGNKIITTGGGGMVVTDDKKLADRIRHLTTQAKKDSVEYDHDEIGYNYRLTNIQAAMGVAQMEKLESFIAIKRKNAAAYKRMFSKILQVIMLWEEPYAKSNFWLCAIKVSRNHKKKLIDFLLSEKIHVRPIWKLIHEFPMYKGCPAYALENARKAYETYINIPSSVGIKPGETEYVVDKVAQYFKKTKRF